MDSNGAKLQLPAIPSLKGKENIGQWKNIIIQTFRFHGMLDYLLQDSTQVVKTPEMKAFGIILIMSSVSPVTKFIEAAGWNFAEVDQDPKDLYDLIVKLYRWRPHMEDIDVTYDPSDLFRDLAAGYFESIEEWHQKVLDLRRQMERADDDFCDDEATEIVVDSLAVLKVPPLYNLLSERLASGDLTWRELMEEIASKCAWGGREN
ncbi:hypothetical protein CONLIGDRAFT_645875 [Coniochaeta ligniaria NRRL 30616]|uniref:Uncharacterized protein n=1 Tax=Coniochaeta ligniaria NRRL 30616 TaxID=1408157 RepID=A0A1J7JJ15_9PEZI|nr:hypothetical protein CONLIGDRAFT_645875 [Coniochaeta ligniaria NRRL 30616]